MYIVITIYFIFQAYYFCNAKNPKLVSLSEKSGSRAKAY